MFHLPFDGPDCWFCFERAHLSKIACYFLLASDPLGYELGIQYLFSATLDNGILILFYMVYKID